MSSHPGPSLLLAPSVRTEVVTTTTVTTTSYAPISLPPLPPPPAPRDPKQYPLLNARFPRALSEFSIVFPDGAQATFKSPPLFPEEATDEHSSPQIPDEEEIVGGRGWKLLKKDEIAKGEEVDIATAIERFNSRAKRMSIDTMDGVETVTRRSPRSPRARTLRANTEMNMRGPSGSTTSAAAPPSPLPSPTGSPSPLFFPGPEHPPPAQSVASDQSAATAHPLQPDVQLTTLMTLPTLLQQFVALPTSLQSHVLLTLLRQSPLQVLRNVNSVLSPTLSRDFLTQLPAELVSMVLGYLPWRTLARCTRVSKSWRAIIDSDPILWRVLLEQTESWFGGGPERAFQRTLVNRRLEKNIPRSLDLPHPYKVLFKSRVLTRTQWQTNPNPKRVTFAAHGSSVVTCLLFSHNRIISASDDHSIHVYNPLTGQLIKSLEGHGGGVWALAATRNTLVSGSTDRTVRIWDLEKGRCTHVFGGHRSTVRCLAIVKPEILEMGNEETGSRKERWPKRTLIVTGSRDHTLRVWKLPKAHEPQFFFVQPEEGNNDSNNNNNNGNNTGNGNPDQIEVADQNPYHLRLLSGHASAVRALAARGRTLVSGSYDHTVRVWDIIDGACKWVLQGHTQKVYSIVLDHERNQACSGSMDSSVRIWNLKTGQCVHVLTGHTSLVGLLGLSHSYLVSAAADSTLRVWNPQTGELLHTLAAHTGAITCFQHDEFKILSGSDGTLKMWDIRDGTNVRDLLTGITGVWQVVFDGRWCVAASNRHDATYLDVWDFGQDVVGEGAEEWIGEGSVDGEDGESEMDEDVTDGNFVDMDHDGEEDEDAEDAVDEDIDEDMAEQPHDSYSQELTTGSVSEEYYRMQQQMAPHNGRIDFSPSPVATGIWSHPASVTGTPRGLGSSTNISPVPFTSGGSMLFASPGTSTLASHMIPAGSIGSSEAGTSATGSAIFPAGTLTGSFSGGSLAGLGIAGASNTVTPTGPSNRTSMAPPPVWSSDQSQSGGAGPSSRGLALSLQARNDDTPSRPTRLRRK